MAIRTIRGGGIAFHSQLTKIPGIGRIFNSEIYYLERCFWILIFLGLLRLSVALSVTLYRDWEDSPVLTTLTTTGLPLKDIEFPAFTICGQGMNNDVLNSGMTLQLFKFLEKKGINVNATAFHAADLFYSKVRFYLGNGLKINLHYI
jgi:hypothetical protein